MSAPLNEMNFFVAASSMFRGVGGFIRCDAQKGQALFCSAAIFATTQAAGKSANTVNRNLTQLFQ